MIEEKIQGRYQELFDQQDLRNLDILVGLTGITPVIEDASLAQENYGAILNELGHDKKGIVGPESIAKQIEDVEAYSGEALSPSTVIDAYVAQINADHLDIGRLRDVQIATKVGFPEGLEQEVNEHHVKLFEHQRYDRMEQIHKITGVVAEVDHLQEKYQELFNDRRFEEMNLLSEATKTKAAIPGAREFMESEFAKGHWYNLGSLSDATGESVSTVSVREKTSELFDEQNFRKLTDLVNSFGSDVVRDLLNDKFVDLFSGDNKYLPSNSEGYFAMNSFEKKDVKSFFTDTGFELSQSKANEVYRKKVENNELDSIIDIREITGLKPKLSEQESLAFLEKRKLQFHTSYLHLFGMEIDEDAVQSLYQSQLEQGNFRELDDTYRQSSVHVDHPNPETVVADLFAKNNFHDAIGFAQATDFQVPTEMIIAKYDSLFEERKYHDMRSLQSTFGIEIGLEQ